ncbi:hypothetical protein J6590_082242 [Homalodisca vitripennis]|nr:hypothetical protein J6590_082242 [Homalodisca vitripennis]
MFLHENNFIEISSEKTSVEVSRGIPDAYGVRGECFQKYSAAGLLYAQRYPDREHLSRKVKDLLVEFVKQVAEDSKRAIP